MRSRFHAAVLCLGLVIAAGPARAETYRLAVVVGNNAGGPADKPLRWAEEDASKVADVLAQLGDVSGDDLELLRGHGQADLRAALERVGQRVAELRRNPADRTVLLFYYSGHSDEEALELGRDRVTWAELRGWLAATRADVRVAIVDGCKSGALVQRKGGTRGPPFEIKLNDRIDAAGEALLTSSASDELALESTEIRGSIFTHHLVSGLRGAADASGDGRVTLSEAYQYAFDHTLAASAATGVRQHPGYDYRLSGKGELVLTEVTAPSASLELPDGFERALVLLVRRDQVLAELQGGGTRRVAVGPGEYAVRLWKGKQAWAGRVTLAAGEARKVAWADLTRLDVPQVAEKGGPGSRPAPELEGLTPEAQAEFLQKYFSVGDEDALSPTYQNTSLDSHPDIYQGRYHREITEPDFFRQVGREDLAREYEHRKTRKVVLIASGIAVATAGLVVGLSGACNVDSANNAQSCITNKTAIIGLSALAGAGIATLGIVVKNSPAGPEEIRRLADQYNEELRRRLATPPPAAEAAAVEVEIQPMLLRGGGGIAIGLRF